LIIRHLPASPKAEAETRALKTQELLPESRNNFQSPGTIPGIPESRNSGTKSLEIKHYTDRAGEALAMVSYISGGIDVGEVLSE